MLGHFWAYLWIFEQSEIWVKLALCKSNCDQMVFIHRLKFKSYIVIYIKNMWSKFHSNMMTKEDMVQAAKCHFVTFYSFENKFWASWK